MNSPIKVSLPLGIGDVHWSCMKLRALSELHQRPIHAYVNNGPNHKSEGYLSIVPFIEKAEYDTKAVRDVWAEMPPNHRHPKWTTLEGCKNWRGFDYVLVANGHLEMGHRIETWLPDLNTDYSYDWNITNEDKTIAESLVPIKPVLLYMSGVGPNIGFHNNTWTVGDWWRTVKCLNENGITPVLIGANTADDKAYRDRFAAQADTLSFIDIVGKTNIPQVCHIIQNASVWCGLNSGLGIVAAMKKTPTVMLWSDSRFRIQGVAERNMLHPNMKTSWLNEQQLETYETLSFGSKDLTYKNVVDKILRVMR